MGGRKTKKVEGAQVKKTKKSKEKGPKEKTASKEGSKKKSRSKKKARGKKYKEAQKKLDSEKYPVEEAVKKVKEVSFSSFDASVDAHINLNLGQGKKRQDIRTFISLPHGTGKDLKILVFATPPQAEEAKKAGADEIGDEDLIEKIAEEEKAPDFDVIVSTPDFMSKVAKIARILGPQGLMPSPKTNTVSDDPAKVVEDLKSGKVELRTFDQSVVHVPIGRISFPDKKLVKNLKVLVEEVRQARPAGILEPFIESVIISPTMGPSVRVSLDSLE